MVLERKSFLSIDFSNARGSQPNLYLQPGVQLLSPECNASATIEHQPGARLPASTSPVFLLMLYLYATAERLPPEAAWEDPDNLAGSLPRQQMSHPVAKHDFLQRNPKNFCRSLASQ